jgi:hypothetical protein
MVSIEPGPPAPPPAHHARPVRHRPQVKNASKHDVTRTQLEERNGLESQEKNKRPEALTLTGLCIHSAWDRIRGWAHTSSVLHPSETWAASHWSDCSQASMRALLRQPPHLNASFLS